ncbi:MAG: hypothetical protein MJA27_11800 [Pseudanabaenales cyanobacterium]|nr:hypothetical protein [Pseudanabaenales cyanobacterium]
MSKSRKLEPGKSYLLILGNGEKSPQVILEAMQFIPEHLELELHFTSDSLRITVNQNRLGKENHQISDIVPVNDSAIAAVETSSTSEEDEPESTESENSFTTNE